MNKFLYDFISMGEKLYKEGLSENFTYYEIRCLYRYCKFELDMKPATIKKLVISQYKEDYFPDSLMDVLEDAEKKSKTPLIPNKPIVFKGYELELLKSIQDRKIRKIVFGMFAVAKVEGKQYYNYKIDFSSRIMNARIKKEDIPKASFLIDKIIVQILGKKEGNTSWIMDIPERETMYSDYPVDFSKISTSLPEFCKECEFTFEPKNNRQEFCEECKKKREVKRVQEWRKNKVVTP